MLQHGIKRLAQLATCNIGPVASSSEGVASSLISRGDAAHSWVQAASISWNPLGCRLHSTTTGGDGPIEGNKNAVGDHSNPTPPLTQPKGHAASAAPIGSVADADIALDAWGAAMDQGRQ